MSWLVFGVILGLSTSFFMASPRFPEMSVAIPGYEDMTTIVIAIGGGVYDGLASAAGGGIESLEEAVTSAYNYYFAPSNPHALQHEGGPPRQFKSWVGWTIIVTIAFWATRRSGG